MNLIPVLRSVLWSVLSECRRGRRQDSASEWRDEDRSTQAETRGRRGGGGWRKEGVGERRRWQVVPVRGWDVFFSGFGREGGGAGDALSDGAAAGSQELGGGEKR